MGGPPCGSWIFINSGTHKRTLANVWGDPQSSYVKRANMFLGYYGVLIPNVLACGCGVSKKCGRLYIIYNIILYYI